MARYGPVQCGYGAVPYDDLSDVYRASYGVQRGAGLGSFLGGVFRFIKPLFLRTAKKVGREALVTGSTILSDIASKKPDEQVSAIVKRRVTEALKRNMGGSGLLVSQPLVKRRRKQAKPKATAGKKIKKRPTRKTKTKKKTKSVKRKRMKRDIFSM